MELDEKYKALPDRITTELMFKVVYDGMLPQEKELQHVISQTHLKSVKQHAVGDIVNQPHLGIIGEAGPEAIIPLSGTNKYRGISLWQQTGELLGMLPKHAQGGIFGGSMDGL